VQREDVIKLMDLISDCNQNFVYTDDKLDTWHELMKDFPAEMAVRNLKEHLKSSSYIPTPADIIKHEPEVFADYDQYRLDTVAFLEHRKQLRLEKRLNPKQLTGGVNPYGH
jgi:hypothetical protein